MMAVEFPIRELAGCPSFSIELMSVQLALRHLLQTSSVRPVPRQSRDKPSARQLKQTSKSQSANGSHLIAFAD